MLGARTSKDSMLADLKAATMVKKVGSKGKLETQKIKVKPYLMPVATPVSKVTFVNKPRT